MKIYWNYLFSKGTEIVTTESEGKVLSKDEMNYFCLLGVKLSWRKENLLKKGNVWGRSIMALTIDEKCWLRDQIQDSIKEGKTLSEIIRFLKDAYKPATVKKYYKIFKKEGGQ